MLWVVFAIIAVQVATGWSASVIRGRADWPEGRWTVLVHRDDAPALFWTMISCQVFLVGLLYVLNVLD